MDRRAFLIASGVALGPLLAGGGAGRAAAATVRLLTLDELVASSVFVLVGRVGEHRCVWDETKPRRRIVTYTRVTVERPVLGEPLSEIWVRTLGGRVDRAVESVPGEAQLRQGTRAMLFLAREGRAVVVSGMAQGHYPIVVEDAGVERLGTSPDAGSLIGPVGSTIGARDRLVGTTVDEAAGIVRATRNAP